MNEMIKYQPQVDIEEIKRVATMMVYSNFFASDGDQNRAIAQIGVKILAGREMGYGAFASVQGIHVIQGKPTLSANLMAAAVKAHPRYNYKVTVMTDDEVSIQFYEDGQPSGVSAFTKKDATAAGLLGKDIWKKFPRNMLFSRALSNGVRWFTPDVFNGNTMYTPEELDADVTVDMATGDIVPVSQPVPQKQAVTQLPEQKQQAVQPETIAPVVKIEEKNANIIKAGSLKTLHAVGTKAYGAEWEVKRHSLVASVTKGRTNSSAELMEDEAQELIAGISKKLQPLDRAA